MKRTDALTGGL